MWAIELGGDLFELRNVPFHAYDLNFRDVVRATTDAPDRQPEVREVVRRSGHRTLRVFFQKSVPEDKRFSLLQSLRFLSVTFEGRDNAFFALDLEPQADIDRVRAELDRWERQGWMAYETCEARVPGSFDDIPADDDASSAPA